MHNETALLATIAVGLALAFIFGFAAARLGLPPLVGYLVAGVALGPFTPGFVADSGLASQLAEVGVILLMFGVGLHFSLRDLLAVRRIAVPGAIAQIVAATVLGASVAHFWVMGERELAFGMTRYALRGLGLAAEQAEMSVQAMRLIPAAGHATPSRPEPLS